ncbi:MAG: CNNM domain-containing protein [Microbacterium arborescens]
MFGLQRELIASFHARERRARDRAAADPRGGRAGRPRGSDGRTRRGARGDLARRSDRLGRTGPPGIGAAPHRDDTTAHGNAVVFIRILAESTAAVFVTAAFTIALENLWWAILVAALLMTAVSFVLVGASPRSVGRQHARGLLIACAPIVRGARIVLAPWRICSSSSAIA